MCKFCATMASRTSRTSDGGSQTQIWASCNMLYRCCYNRTCPWKTSHEVSKSFKCRAGNSIFNNSKRFIWKTGDVSVQSKSSVPGVPGRMSSPADFCTTYSSWIEKWIRIRGQHPVSRQVHFSHRLSCQEAKCRSQGSREPSCCPESTA